MSRIDSSPACGRSSGPPPEIDVGRPAILAASVRTTVASIAGQAPGFLVPILVAATLGATRETDAFFLALAFASFLVNALAAAAQQAAIPFLVERSGERRRAFLSELLGLMGLGSAALAVVLLLATPWLLRELSAVPDHALIRQLLAVLVPFVVLSGAANVWTGVLNADRAYLTPALSPALRALPAVGLLLAVGARLSVFALAGAYLLGEGGRALLLGLAVRRRGMPVRPVWPRSAIRQFLGSGASQILGSALLGATPVIDRLMVSSLGPGRLSILEYAERAWQVPLALAMSGFMVVSVSEWSRAAPGAVAIRPLTRATVRTAGMLFAGSVPVCLAAIAARHWLVTLVFGHGRLTPEELVVLGDVFGLFTVALPVYAVGLVYTRAVLVLKRSDILLGINIGQLAVKLALNVLLVRSWGVAGVALSSAGMYGLGTAILVIGYHARLTRATGRPAP